jgi:hypothetical protein
MRRQYGFLGEEGAQIKKLPTTNTVLLDSATKLLTVTVPNTHDWNIQIQNFLFGATTSAVCCSEPTPATRGGFSFGLISFNRH